VISTWIKDVVDPYAINGLIKIADTSDEFINAAESIFTNGVEARWLRNVDHFLAGNSWDKAWTSMLELIRITLDEKNKLSTPKTQHYV
jgi:UDP-galactopyranose mutase